MKDKYYHLDEIKALDADYNIIIGERSNGKSFAVKENCINDYLDDKGNFVYLRRWDMDIKKTNIDKYFADEELVKKLKKKTNGLYDCLSYYGGDIYMSKHINRKTIERIDLCGFSMSLSGGTHFKSVTPPNVKNIIFEEFITDDMYLEDEITLFFNLISTVARRRKVKVWLIGNTISRLCPYFDEWGLTNTKKQKKGTIDVYTHKVDTIINGHSVSNEIKIAVELCNNIVENKMFFGDSASMISGGEWQTKKYPKLPKPREEAEILYRVLIVKYNMSYMMEVLKYDYTLLYVYPATKYKFEGRILCNVFFDNPLITENLTPITRGDKIVLSMIEQNKICFSDNLTGSEFYTLLKGGDII